MTDARCEPPEGWRAVEDTRRRLLEAADFMAQERAVYVPNLLLTAARQLGQLSRTTQPVATPTELATLRAEVARAEASEWCQKVQLFEDVAHRRKNERDAIGIAFTKLSAVLRVNMLRHVPGTSHAEIDAAIDACLGPVARAALARAKAEGL